MTAREDALVRVGMYANPDQAPALTPEQVGLVLDSCAILDLDGRLPTDPAWTGRWDENLAVAECYAIKASKVAGNFNFSADGASYNKGDVLANLLEMEAKYRARAGAGAGGASGLGSLTTRGSADFSTLDAIAARVIP